MRVRFLTVLLGFSLCGCAAVQDYHYCLAQKHRASSAWKEYYGSFNGCSRHYQDGWKQGYYDVSTGQCEEPPPVPPHKYWHASYANPAGREAIAEWYSGWQDGATAAVQDGNPFFHEIPASPTGAGVHADGPFHGGGEMPGMHDMMPGMEKAVPGTEKLPPAEPQAKVHVAPVPQRFASTEIPANNDDEGLLDESALPQYELQTDYPETSPEALPVYDAPESSSDPYYAGADMEEAAAEDAAEYEDDSVGYDGDAALESETLSDDGEPVADFEEVEPVEIEISEPEQDEDVDGYFEPASKLPVKRVAPTTSIPAAKTSTAKPALSAPVRVNTQPLPDYVDDGELAVPAPVINASDYYK